MSAPAPRPGLAPLLAAAERAIASEAGRAEPFPQPEPDTAIARLADLFDLTAFEVAIVATAAAVELVPGFGASCARAAGHGADEALTPALAVARLPAAHWQALEPNGTLRRYSLVKLAEGPVFTARAMTLAEPVLHLLMGRRAADPAVNARVRHVPAAVAQPPSRAILAERIAEALSDQDSGHVQLVTPSAAEARGLAAAAAALQARSVWELPATNLPPGAEERALFLSGLARDLRLNGALLLLDATDTSDPGQLSLAGDAAERFPDTILLAGPDLVPAGARRVFSLPIAPLPHAEAAALWRIRLAEAGLADGTEPDVLAAQFQLSPEAIADVVANARHGDAPPSTRVWHACRMAARARLDDLAQRITPATGAGLVLPPEEARTLRAIAAQVRHRARVFHTWGLADLGHRTGTTAIFHGPSGTGKTLAAEVLAAELDLDLYRIDLSAVVSKFIGETEKNLRRVFDAADESGTILLFDEADALFGKRTEVKDSHDRHANVEVSYLLQRMETYRGLAILTTNLRKNIDDAFMRRIQFVVEFPFPTPELRAEIWRRAFPTAMPLDRVNVEALSSLAVAGGNIKTIARNAAFLAAADGNAVGMDHLLDAARREYAKLGRTLTAAEMRGWLR